MKKLKLSLQNIEGAEILTREQLKMIMGGSGDEVLSTCTTTCKTGTEDEYTVSIDKCKGTCKGVVDNGVSCSDPYQDESC